MFFWKKNKTIVLDCFTSDPFAYEYAKIAPSTQYYPEWWQNIKREIETGKDEVFGRPIISPTVKGCRGITSLYKHSYVIPMWEFLTINVHNNKYSWQTNNNPQLIAKHSPVQYEGWVDNENYTHFKIISPWWLKTKSDINFMYVDPVWGRSEIADYCVLPGILDFKYQYATHINMMVQMTEKFKSIKFTPGTPLVHIVPLTDKNIDLRCHLVDRDKIAGIVPNTRLNYPEDLSVKQYAYKKKFLNDHEARSEKKCPFGFK